MRKNRLFPLLFLSSILFLDYQIQADPPLPSAEITQFRMQELEKGLEVGYAVVLADVNNDGKLDIVVVDSQRVVWYENPSWKMRIMIQGGTKRDNVCIAAADVDGDGLLDFAVGAEWKPFNTKSGGTLQWLKRGKTLDDPWSIYPIDLDLPTIHRIRFADIDGDGKPELITAPLMGRGSSQAGNWLDGAPVEITAYRIPKDPTRDRWQTESIDRSLHVTHNVWPIASASRPRQDLLTASYEGVHLLSRIEGKWQRSHLGAGNQETPKGKRGSSEIKMGRLKSGKKFLATVEPWHGDQIVVYSEPTEPGQLWIRQVLDEDLRWGHAVWCADLDGDGSDELIIGIRDDPGPKDTIQGRRGVRIYQAQDERGTKWTRQLVEVGGMACEDLQAADLDGDGRVDLVATGRATRNVRIYWNLGKN